MTALSETQKELGSYFKCLDEEKYMMTIPPLQPKPTEENPYLNFSRPPLAPPQPRRPIRCIEEKVSPQLNPFYGKQILWPKEQNFDLKQYDWFCKMEDHLEEYTMDEIPIHRYIDYGDTCNILRSVNGSHLFFSFLKFPPRKKAGVANKTQYQFFPFS